MSGIVNSVGARSGIIGGAVTMPNQPSFHYYGVGGWISWTNSGAHLNIFGSKLHDTGNDFASSQFTAPVAGVYYFHAVVYSNTISSGTTTMQILVDGSQKGYALHGQTTNAEHRQLSIVVDLAEGQVVKVTYSTPTNIYSGANHTWFEGHLLG